MSPEAAIILGISISLVLSALFSGTEIAFISSDKLHIEVQKKKGKLIGRILSVFTKKPTLFISALLIGNTATLVLYSQLMTIFLQPLQESIPNLALLMTVQTVISTLIVLFIAEYLPKSLFLINPNRMLSIFAVPVSVIYYILFPFVWVIVTFSKFFITRVFKWDYSDEQPAFQITDLNNYIERIINKSKAAKKKVEIDTKIFTNALEFKSVRVRECMIPRIEIIAVDVEEDISELKKQFIKSGHSKVLIYNKSIDNIIGYCHSLTLFKKPEKIDDIITPIMIVPETKLANELMIDFIDEHKSVALVVDEFGGTSGIVTIEDVIEEIFGEIRDEHDEEDHIEQKLNDTTFIFSARHEIDYLNEKYKINIPGGDYDTLGGYILSINEDIPKVNEVIRKGEFSFTVKSMIGTRIDRVRLEIFDPEDN